MSLTKGAEWPLFYENKVSWHLYTLLLSMLQIPGRDLRIKAYTGMFFPAGWCDTGGTVTGQGMNKYPGEW
jgi:hypothetical protein